MSEKLRPMEESGEQMGGKLLDEVGGMMLKSNKTIVAVIVNTKGKFID